MTTTRLHLTEGQALTAAAVVAGLPVFAASLAPALDITLTAGLPAAVIAVLAVRRIARALRWRREDRDDEITAAAWRATHTTTDTAAAAGRGVA